MLLARFVPDQEMLGMIYKHRASHHHPCDDDEGKIFILQASPPLRKLSICSRYNVYSPGLIYGRFGDNYGSMDLPEPEE